MSASVTEDIGSMARVARLLTGAFIEDYEADNKPPSLDDLKDLYDELSNLCAALERQRCPPA